LHPTVSIDGRNLAGCSDDQVLANPIGMLADQAVMVFDASSVAIADPGLKQQLVVEESWHVEMDVHVADDQERSTILDLPVGDPRGAKHFDPTSFKVIQVLSIVDSTLTVDLMIVDADRYFVLVIHLKNLLKSR
jgi:hypothetical protein